MTIRELNPTEAVRELDRFQVVDVRAEHEFRGPLGRVKGAQLVPLGELEARAAEIPKDAPLLLVCRSGKRSGMACATLVKLGVGPVANLAGGMIGWNRAGLPIEQDEPATLVELLESVIAWMAQVTALTPEGARDLCRKHLEGLGVRLQTPTPKALHQLLELIEATLHGDDVPPDLDLTLTAFRRQLAVL